MRLPSVCTGDGNSHESVRIMLKTTQTSGFWLGFGRDTRRDGALWAIHVQPRENGLHSIAVLMHLLTASRVFHACCALVEGSQGYVTLDHHLQAQFPCTTDLWQRNS